MKLNNKDLKEIMKTLNILVKDERLGETEKAALTVLSDFTFKVSTDNFVDNINKYFDDIERVRADFIIYCVSFQKFNMDQKRNIEELEGLIDAIPHNRGFIRNGIVFEGTFDNLLQNIDAIKDNIISCKKKYTQLSLNEFINLTL